MIKKLIFAAIVALFFSKQVAAMSIFKPKDVCVFSSVKGVLLREGKPLPGVEVLRWGKWSRVQ